MGDVTKIFFLYKISEERYLEALATGEVYFSCCGRFMNIAKSGCGKGQGDRYECVFAKYLKKNSRKPIQKYKKMFGKDLLVETEGDYVLLRRKSSLYVPTACFYSIDNNTAIQNLNGDDKVRIEEIINANQDKEELTISDFPLSLSEKYFEEFNLSNDKINAIMIQPNDFLCKLTEKNVKYRKVAYIDMDKEYDIFGDELFKKYYGSSLSLNEALEKRIEMFFKDKSNYEHQCEIRLVLRSKLYTSINQGYIVKLTGLKSMSTDYKSKVPANANGYDFICNVKNGQLKAEIIMAKPRLI